MCTVSAADRVLSGVVHIYLCDDAPDDLHEDYRETTFHAVTLRKELVQRISSKCPFVPVIRVGKSPERTMPEQNPKACNLNSCLKSIYGEGDAALLPDTEVVALLDADQAAQDKFLTTLLPWLDAGDDVALVQSPQVVTDTVAT